MPQLRVYADHLCFEGESVPPALWQDFDVLYGCLEQGPMNPDLHLLLVGVTCHTAPGQCHEMAWVFVQKSSIRQMDVLE